MYRFFAVLGLALTAFGQVAPPTPESYFGFRMGADMKLAKWDDLVGYYRVLDAASDRIALREIDRTTLDKPFVVVEVSSPGNLARRDELRGLQKKLASGRFADAAERADIVKRARGVVYLNCNLHSTEIASSLMIPELLHRYATSSDPSILRMLEQCVLVVAPSANPDGIDIVVDWYRKTVGTPWEGTSPPILYHPYIGHDNNRDWFMLTQKETRSVTRVLYEEWLPAVVYDIHQMGNGGARYFVPPFTDPVNPNLDPLLQRTLGLYGTYMAKELSRAGKTGVAQGIVFDNWWNGGARNVPYRHNMIGILTEAASARLASPVFQKLGELKGHGHALPDYKPQTNFPDPWEGGWWRLRDIVEYELISVDAVMNLTTRLREDVNDSYAALAERAIQRGLDQPPYAWVIPAEQRDRSSLWRLLKNLDDTGVELSRAAADFEAAGARFKKGDWVILAAQPYRAHVKDLLERQEYPEIKASVTGEIIKPYDNAGWTLPLQFGVSVKTIVLPFRAELERIDTVAAKQTPAPTAYPVAIDSGSNDAFVFVNRTLAAGHAVEVRAEKLVAVVDAAAFATLAEGLAFRTEPAPAGPAGKSLARPRVAIYKPWTASMDEGWTRHVLEEHGFQPTPLDDAAMRTIDLKAVYDVVVIASMSKKSIVAGNDAADAPPEIRGGLGAEGVENLKRFVKAGGRLIAFGAAVSFAAETFGLGLVDAVDDQAEKLTKEEREARKDLSCPGSILTATFDHGVAAVSGIETEWPVFYAQNPVFEFTKDAAAVSRGRLAEASPLLSGYLRRPEVVAGKVALAAAECGQGTVYLFSFRPQNRGQSLGTFRLIFTAVLGLWR